MTGRMTKPAFWGAQAGLGGRVIALMLWPVSLLYVFGYMVRRCLVRAKPLRAALICVGNIVAGGAGKTPTVLMLCEAVERAGIGRVCILMKGYGGTQSGPLIVDPAAHDAAQVGDEAMMCAMHGWPVVMAKDRAAGAAFAEGLGFDVIVMDDGLQNPALRPAVSLCVIDAGYGVGNGMCLPAGPMREPVFAADMRVDGYIVVGGGTLPPKMKTAKPVWAGWIVPDETAQGGVQGLGENGRGMAAGERSGRVALGLASGSGASGVCGATEVVALRGVGRGAGIGAGGIGADGGGAERAKVGAAGPVLAFAGIGRPEKFYQSLRKAGVQVVETCDFPDHYPYGPSDIEALRARAAQSGAQLMTTEKDMMRIPVQMRDGIEIMAVRLKISDEAEFIERLAQRLRGAGA